MSIMCLYVYYSSCPHTAVQRRRSKVSLQGSFESLNIHSDHFRELTDATIVINYENITMLENIGEGILSHSNNIYSMKVCLQGSLGLCIKLDFMGRNGQVVAIKTLKGIIAHMIH